MADGKIKIETKLDNKGIEKDLKGLSSMVQRAMNSIKNMFKGTVNNKNLEEQLKEQKNLLKEQEKELNSYQKRLNNIDNETPVKLLQKQIDAANKIIENAKKKIDEYRAKMNELETAAQKKETQAYENAKMGGAPGTQFDDSPKNLKRRAGKDLANDADYQKIIDLEIKIGQKIDEYSGKVQEAKARIKELATSFSNVKNAQAKALSNGMEDYNSAIEKTKGKITSLQAALSKLKSKADLSRSTDKNTSSLKKAGSAAAAFGSNVSKSTERGISKLVKMGLAIFSIRTAYAFASKAANMYLQSNEQLSNQVTAMWNVVAQAIGPVIQTVIGWITTLMSYINTFIKSFTGIDLIAKGNAAALKKQAEATGKVAKETEKANRQLAAFDEMTKLNNDKTADTGGSSGGTDVPQLVVDPVNIDGLKEKLLKLFEPVKNAWTNYGQAFVDSFKYGLGQIWELTKSIGRSFEEVWLNGTGELTCSLILQILTNVFDLVGNLARQFRKAWDAAGLGTQIIQNIWDVVNILLGGVNDVSKSLADWAGTIDFTPILQSIEKLTGKLKPLAELISGAVLWAFDNVLEPLGSWIIEDALPPAIDVFSAALDILTSVLQSLEGPAMFIWDNFLQPIASWTGGVIVTVLEGLADILETIGSWMKNNEKTVTAITTAVIGFFGAWQVAKLLAFIQQSGGVVAALKSITGGLVTSTAAKLADKAETIALTAMYAKDFVVSLAKGTAELVKQCAQWVITTGLKIADTAAQIGMTAATIAWNAACTIATAVTTAFGAAVAFLTSPIGLVVLAVTALIAIVVLLVKNWDTVKEAAGKVWDGICNIWNAAAGWFNQNVVQPIANFFGGLWDGIKTAAKNAWDWILGLFSGGGKIFNGLKDGIVNVFKLVINCIIDGLNKIIAIPFKAINGILNEIRTFDIPLIGQPFKGLWGKNPLPVPQIPKLAKGGIVNNPGPGVNMGNYIAGERGPEAVIPISDSQFVKDFAEEIAKHIDTSSPINIVLKVGDKEFYKWFINMQKKYNYITNGG